MLTTRLFGFLMTTICLMQCATEGGNFNSDRDYGDNSTQSRPLTTAARLHAAAIRAERRKSEALAEAEVNYSRRREKISLRPDEDELDSLDTHNSNVKSYRQVFNPHTGGALAINPDKVKRSSHPDAPG